MGKKKSKCNLCCNNGKDINNMGDSFSLSHEEGECWHLCAEQRNVFLMLKIKYCPMCGRKLKKKD